MEDNQNSKVYIFAAVVLGLSVGYYFGSVRGYSSGYETARADIKTRLEDKKIIQPTLADIRVISGTIRSIGANQFVMESQLPYDPTLPEGEQVKTVSKTVLITSATLISVRTVEANQATPKAGETFRPFIVKNVKIDVSALKISDAVVVEAGENIADKTSFEAVSVFKNSQ
ncbi:MAG: hypothetical protein Q7S19_03960 [bacterium]|nr:hypothetical protein [bacterium]